MQQIDQMIVRDIEDDPVLRVKGLGVEIKKKGLFSSRKLLRITATVRSEHEREKMLRIAEHHTGDAYDVVDEITVAAEEPSNA